MSTVSVMGKVISGGQEYEFNVADSYTFRNNSILVVVLADRNEFIETIKDTPYCEGDGYLPYKILNALDVILNNNEFSKVYYNMRESKITEGQFHVERYSTYMTIDYDKEAFIFDDETFQFSELQENIIEDLFNG